MLQSLLSAQPCVLIVDHARLERKSSELVGSLSSTANIHLDSLPAHLNIDPTILQLGRQDLNAETYLTSIIPGHVLINVAAFTQLFTLKSLFQLVHSLKACPKVKQLWLWASPATIGQEMVVPYLEHMSSAVLTLKDAVNMSLLSKKSGGLVSKKLFSYRLQNNRFEVAEVKSEVIVKDTEPAVNPESLTTFKINFDDEELEARNTLKLPYERTSDEIPTESKIIYHPDADDDFDEEDPDDDLNI